jgi:Ca-activated chloride channel family protein
MEFSNPDILWGLIAVPVLVVVLIYGYRRRREAMVQFTGPVLSDALAPGRSWRKSLLKGFLKTTALALLVVALAGPRFGTRLVKVEREGVDLVITLDTSLSMLAEDMLPNRLERAKQEMIDLIRGLRGDRVGIVVFAGKAFALCPLTVDYDAALMFTRSVGVDVVSEPGTNLADAIDVSVALFDKSERQDRAIILVTDGESHEGNAVEAAKTAGSRGIRIYTIGIGNPAGELIPERGTTGSVEGYKKDSHGETVLTQLDERTLQEVASASGGKYLPATREGLELKVLYNEISGMEKKRIRGEFVERKKERFWIFLCGALLALFLDAVVTSKARLRGGRRGRLLHSGAAVLALMIVPVVAGARTVDAGKVKSGNKYFDAGEYDKAMTLYVESMGDTLKLPKNYQGVLYNLGNTLYQQEKYKDAIQMYQGSYSPDSTLNGNVLYNRANALLRSGDPASAVQSYVQALMYLPDDEDVRHNLELALEQLQQQRQQQQQQQQDQSKDRKEQGENKRQQQQRQEQKEQEERQDKQKGDEQEQEQQQQPDSTQMQSPPPQPDSTQALPQPQLSEEDMKKLSKEDAMRILRALEESEKKLQAERHKAAFRRQKKTGKDW